jgi:protoporphyrinogen oxidase
MSSAPRRCASLPTRIEPKSPPDNRRRPTALKYRDFLTVALMIRSEDLFPDNWIYIHDSKVKVGRIQNFRSWSPEMVPDPSHGLCRPRIFLLRGRHAVVLLRCRPDRACHEAKWRILGLCKPEDVVGGAVVRQEKAYPVYDDGYADNVAAMRDELEARYPTLHLGRPQRYAPLQQPGSRDDDRDADRPQYRGGIAASMTPGPSTRMPNITRRGMRAKSPTPR